MASREFPRRQIHLDFHTGPDILDVGAQFNAREFAATFKAAHIDSVTVFAKCHHGHLYYKTPRPERHPGLPKSLDLLAEQVDALHSAGIRAPIYISILCDEYAANTHPEWIARDAQGAPVRRPGGIFNPGWQIMEMTSPYQEYLAEQTSEVLKLFKPVDGIFFDMCWDQPSTNRYFIDAMRRADLDPESPADRDRVALQVSRDYMKRFYRMVQSSSPGASVFFNARSLDKLAPEISTFSHVEIEALPTGGWGYLYFPRHVRHVRTLGRPYLGQTARFHKSWADFGGIKPYAALEYETSLMMAHGAACSVGDQLHPRGKLEQAAYDLVGKAYARVEDREPWLRGAVPVTQIGVLQTSAAGTRSEEGVTQMLTQLKHQFDIISPAHKFSEYEVLILPDAVELDPATTKRLSAFLRQGGAMLATGTAGLSDNAQKALPQLGIEPEGLSPFTATYVRFAKEISRDIPAIDHVMYDRGVRVRARPGTKQLASIVEPYFERTWAHFCSHRQTPPQKLTQYAAAVLKGRVGYIPLPVFDSYANHGSLACRWLVDAILSQILPDPLIRLDAPAMTEATITRQGGRTIVHILHYSPQRRTPSLDIVEDIVPLFDIKLSLKTPRKPTRVYLAPDKSPLEFQYANGRTETVIPRIEGHAMVIFE
jgi:Hypothetical glycosyl hydrolase 6/Beta-galactosidase trimerisation domain